MLDHNSVIKALVEGRLSDAGNDTISLVATDDEDRFDSLEWEVHGDKSCIRCHYNFRERLESQGRIHWATRLASMMITLEAAHHFTLASSSAFLYLGDSPFGPNRPNLFTGATQVNTGIAFCSSRSDDLLVPGPDFILSHGYADRNLYYDEQPPWQRRLPVAFWRGETLGHCAEGEWRELPRLQLCRVALRARQIDAGVTSIGQLPDGAEKEIAEAGLMRAYIPGELFHLYRCHIDIDGNSNSWRGLFTKLLTGSPVLKVTSPHGFRQWYYNRMTPWEHYVPVEADLSDLVEKADWVLADGDRAAKIGAAGRAFALSMTFEREIADVGMRISRWLQPSSSHAEIQARSGVKPEGSIDKSEGANKARTSRMSRARALMEELYGVDVYAGFVPTFPADLQGWNSQHDCFSQIISSIRPEIVLDVGVWKGASTIFLAQLMRDHNIDGVVIGIDSFLGSVEHSVRRSSFYNLIPRQFGRPMLYEQFLANVVRSELHDIIVPLPQTTTNAASLLANYGIKAGLIHIDAAHDRESVLQDARNYWQLLGPGGYLVGDDYQSIWPGVVEGADQFSAEIGQELEVRAPKWLQRKSS